MAGVIKKPNWSVAKPQLSQALNEVGIDTNSENELELRDCKVNGQELSFAKNLQVDNCRIESSTLASAKLNKFDATDAILERLEAAGAQSRQTAILRVQLQNSRFTGADFPEAHFEDCHFKNVKFDEAGFRFASFKRVIFENCVLKRADFSHAKLTKVKFEGCDLELTNFDTVTCVEVDLGSENLSSCQGILGLKGAIITDEQLIQIAPLLANELGFKLTAKN